jgi:uncharacterized membrane protein
MSLRFILERNTSASLTMKKWLIISCAFSCLLLTARVIITGYLTYVFLAWNLFLAFLPYAITEWIWARPRMAKNKVMLSGFMSLWMLFIPNSFYILTDLFHLDDFHSAPKWFDLLMIFSFAWNGLLLGLMSVRKTELILEVISGRGFSLFIVFMVMWLNAFGIYIGRYLRFNSWDIITQPFSLFNEMFEVLLHPVRNKMEWGMIMVYAFFMTVLYITVKKLGENFQTTDQK